MVKMSRPVVFTGVFAVFCATAGRADQPQPELGTNHPIVRAVRSAGQQLYPEDVKEWRGDRTAYDALTQMLGLEPVSGTEWRNAIDAVAVIAAAKADLGEQALSTLERFA